MSNRTGAPHTGRPAPQTSTDRPTATYPTGDHLARLEREEAAHAAHRERLNDRWEDFTPTEELPVVPDRPAAGPARQGRQARPSRARRHLRAALAGALAAAALLTGLSLYAADGIGSARRAALEQARSQAAHPASQAPASVSPSSRSAWTVHGTGAPYDRTDPAASPLDLPRCTAAPDTPMPCLAHISNDSHHVTVLEEDASLTGLDRG